MSRIGLAAVGVLGLALAGRTVAADDVRYLEDNGITYRETTQVVKRPIPHTEMQPRECTYYRERVTTDLQEVTRSYQVPVTEYQYQPHLEGRWNPFAQPYMTYRMVPVTRWETKTEVVKIPVARREIVPEKITQNVPVTTHKIAEERVVTRVAVGTKGSSVTSDPFANPSGSAGTVAANPSTGTAPNTLPAGDQFGGVSKLDPNQPKQNPDWRASDALLRR